MDRRTFLSLLGAAGVSVGLAGPAAHASGPAAAPRGPHQPFLHGYDAEGLKNWSPETDRWARHFRSRVPLAERIAPFAATQADPALATGPRVMNLSYDYDNSFFHAFPYNDVFARRLLRFWQYTDLYGSWHGMPVDGSPADEPVHGVVNLPNPAWTDAAHRNGARSLGCWFWPREGTFSAYLEQRADGSFPVADKLIEMAAYFGFDGYFLNQEAETAPEDAAKLLEMLSYLRRRAPEGFHLQWYDTITTDGSLDYQNQLNGTNAPWIRNGETPVAHSLFANYWLPDAQQVVTSRETAERLGLDPYEVVFHGTENEKYGYNPPYDTRLIFPEGQPARTSWALFGSHFAWDRHPDREDPGAQDAVFRRERRYWSGPEEDPTRTGRTEYVPWPEEDEGKPRDADNHRKWDGVARYITERSVIGSFPFVTRFNTGHGRAFFLGGERVSDREWNNIGIQDVLPTWQFWTRSGGPDEPLAVDFDYGLAWDGGSSLRIAGALGPRNPTTVRLFKTALEVTGAETLSVTFRTGRAGAASGLELGLVLADAPDRFAWLPAGRTASGGWNTVRLPLAPFRGRTVAALGVRVSAGSGAADGRPEPYVLHLGELALTGAPPAPPARPAGFAVDAVHRDGDVAEVFVSWRLAERGVWYYDLLGERPGGGPEALGRIYGEVFYVKSLARNGKEAARTLRLVPVAPDGTRGAPATARVRWE
ncbi:hypothetical protein [Streptomyces sp. HNM0574]|uniref:endo-beta-N-acetylglucosaminidase n=1 Tax=Streptomyces sp. HNM0574 TaxID=2714954 RepID=UPI00146D897E|nr:hypothetical protein [Streptomyces sp. HNM0574]NLU71004.1 hypothetical protein [Streptomyces sp. HNM0574]